MSDDSLHFILLRRIEKNPILPFMPGEINKNISKFIDQHIGQRIQLRRNILGMTQKQLAEKCGVTFQQMQKYEAAENRISASRLLQISTALETPISFFYSGTQSYMPGGINAKLAEPAPNDPFSNNESLELMKLYWKLPSDDQRKTILSVLQGMLV
ncbi:MAG: helix-turn-helix domain-containing protein [Rickettsiales bacterium]|nr:helix-turn-helix domain-containing protein [Rickettsiales bacterium]